MPSIEIHDVYPASLILVAVVVGVIGVACLVLLIVHAFSGRRDRRKNLP